jgi:hypothetical protein
MTDESRAGRMTQLLSAKNSAARAELVALSFDTFTSLPLSAWLADPALAELLIAALREATVERVLERHALPFVARVRARMHEQTEPTRAALPAGAEQRLNQIVAQASGPRFSWLKGALDGADVRELLAPVVQAVLLQFATKLPAVAGLNPQGAAGAALGGFVGLLGKQVQKTARDLAEVGKNVMGGLSGEFERRMQGFARDFTQTAMLEFRAALIERLGSEEGRAILVRMRKRLIQHILDTPQSEIADDLGSAPFAELACWAPDVVVHVRERDWFGELLRGEVQAVLETVGARSADDLLREAGIEVAARELALRTFDGALEALFSSASFASWLERLLTESGAR